MGRELQWLGQGVAVAWAGRWLPSRSRSLGEVYLRARVRYLGGRRAGRGRYMHGYERVTNACFANGQRVFRQRVCSQHVIQSSEGLRDSAWDRRICVYICA